MLTELKSVAETMKGKENKEIRKQFNGVLLPIIERIAEEGRMLFVHVSTRDATSTSQGARTGIAVVIA
jgi:hypothetical protein